MNDRSLPSWVRLTHFLNGIYDKKAKDNNSSQEEGYFSCHDFSQASTSQSLSPCADYQPEKCRTPDKLKQLRRGAFSPSPEKPDETDFFFKESVALPELATTSNSNYQHLRNSNDFQNSNVLKKQGNNKRPLDNETSTFSNKISKRTHTPSAGHKTLSVLGPERKEASNKIKKVDEFSMLCQPSTSYSNNAVDNLRSEVLDDDQFNHGSKHLNGMDDDFCQAMTKPGEETNSKNVTLKSWAMLPMSEERIRIEGIVAKGKHIGRTWRSTAIFKRVDPFNVQSRTGTTYTLRMPMNKEVTAMSGFNNATINAFSRGFPSNWQKLIKVGKKTNRIVDEKVEDEFFKEEEEEKVLFKEKEDSILDDTIVLNTKVKPRIKKIDSAKKKVKSAPRQKKKTKNSTHKSKKKQTPVKLNSSKQQVKKRLDESPAPPDDDIKILVEMLPRSSRGRKIIPPLKWWANERVSTPLPYVMQTVDCDLTISQPTSNVPDTLGSSFRQIKSEGSPSFTQGIMSRDVKKENFATKPRAQKRRSSITSTKNPKKNSKRKSPSNKQTKPKLQNRQSSMCKRRVIIKPKPRISSAKKSAGPKKFKSIKKKRKPVIDCDSTIELESSPTTPKRSLRKTPLSTNKSNSRLSLESVTSPPSTVKRRPHPSPALVKSPPTIKKRPRLSLESVKSPPSTVKRRSRVSFGLAECPPIKTEPGSQELTENPPLPSRAQPRRSRQSAGFYHENNFSIKFKYEYVKKSTPNSKNVSNVKNKSISVKGAQNESLLGKNSNLAARIANTSNVQEKAKAKVKRRTLNDATNNLQANRQNNKSKAKNKSTNTNVGIEDVLNDETLIAKSNKENAITAKKGTLKYKRQVRQLIDDHNKGYEADMFENVNSTRNASIFESMLQEEDDAYSVCNYATPVINSTLLSMRPAEEESTIPAVHSGITPSLLKSLNRSDMDCYNHERKKWKKAANSPANKKKNPTQTVKSKTKAPAAIPSLSSDFFDVVEVEDKNYDEEAEGPKDYYFD